MFRIILVLGVIWDLNGGSQGFMAFRTPFLLDKFHG